MLEFECGGSCGVERPGGGVCEAERNWVFDGGEGCVSTASGTIAELYGSAALRRGCATSVLRCDSATKWLARHLIGARDHLSRVFHWSREVYTDVESPRASRPRRAGSAFDLLSLEWEQALRGAASTPGNVARGSGPGGDCRRTYNLMS